MIAAGEVEYDTATGTFIPRRPVVPPLWDLPAEPPPSVEPPASVEPAPPADPSAVASAEAEARSAKAEAPPAGPAPPAAPPDPVPAAELPEPLFRSGSAALVGPIDQVEPVAFDRVRADGWTPARQRQFLEELADCGIVKEAAARVGMTRQSAWQLRRRAWDTPFHAAWEHALRCGMQRLHSVAFERAVEGVVKPLFYHGQKIGEHRIYDNRLLVTLLGKAGEPYDRDRAVVVENRWEEYLEAVERGWRRPQPRLESARDDYVWQEEDGSWWTYLPAPRGIRVIEKGQRGDEDYCRTLTEAERDAVTAVEERERELDCAERDRFFGFEK